jgi:hypothetical protein
MSNFEILYLVSQYALVVLAVASLLQKNRK